MAEQSSTEQLLELLVQLKVSVFFSTRRIAHIQTYHCQKTTSNAARDILSSQPAIAYALISLMVSVGAIDVEVFQVIVISGALTCERLICFYRKLFLNTMNLALEDNQRQVYFPYRSHPRLPIKIRLFLFIYNHSIRQAILRQTHTRHRLAPMDIRTNKYILILQDILNLQDPHQDTLLTEANRKLNLVILPLLLIHSRLGNHRAMVLHQLQ